VRDGSSLALLTPLTCVGDSRVIVTLPFSLTVLTCGMADAPVVDCLPCQRLSCTTQRCRSDISTAISNRWLRSKTVFDCADVLPLHLLVLLPGYRRPNQTVLGFDQFSIGYRERYPPTPRSAMVRAAIASSSVPISSR